MRVKRPPCGTRANCVPKCWNTSWGTGGAPSLTVDCVKSGDSITAKVAPMRALLLSSAEAMVP